MALVLALDLGLAISVYSQVLEERLLSFGSQNQAGHYPAGLLVQGHDGAFYGTTQAGGAETNGTVFKLSADGLSCTVLHTFSAAGNDGRRPGAGLVQANDGVLYGTTTRGGSRNYGTVFKLNTNGINYSVIHHFSGAGGDGSDPEAELVQGRDGAFYGTTRGGGGFGCGTVFRLTSSGSVYAVLHSFAGSGVEGDGKDPRARLVQGSDGALYGTTYSGGAVTNWGGTVYTNNGTVFKLNMDGTGYRVLYACSPWLYDAILPAGGLVQGSDGALYGTSLYGGSIGDGAIFKLNPDGTDFAIVYSFNYSGSSGCNPQASLILGRDGLLYGTAYQGGSNHCGTVFKVRTNGFAFVALHQFGSGAADGQSPPAALAQAGDGTLFGLTYAGGTCGWGTAFKLGTNGANYAVLYNFGADDLSGSSSYAELAPGPDGALYSTTAGGGVNGYGTIYRLNPDGNAGTTVYEFSRFGTGGRNPYAPLYLGADGAFYGTTCYGGSNGVGTVFRYDPNTRAVVWLHHFDTSGGDGQNPYSRLTQSGDGLLYGTTYNGGTDGAGSVFRLRPDGAAYLVLHSFQTNGVDGQNCWTGLIQAGDGALYGSTMNGGLDGGGILFRLDPDGSNYAVLHSFVLSPADGFHPAAQLVRAGNGVLYGTTLMGGAYDYGALFKYSTDGTGYRMLFSFPLNSPQPRWQPVGPLARSQDGTLYGATCYGGDYNLGAVYQIGLDGLGFSVLFSFGSVPGDGMNPRAGVVLGTDGAWYGTTDSGGTWGSGSVFRFATLPSILVQPGSLTNSPDTTATFLVSAGGTQPLTFQWQKNGTNLVDNAHIGGSRTATLILQHVSADDQGSYSVIVANRAGSVISLPAMLTVISPPSWDAVTRLMDGSCRFSLVALPGLTYRIDTSTNLVEWQAVTNLPSLTGSVDFIDFEAAPSAQRFYRAVWVP